MAPRWWNHFYYFAAKVQRVSEEVSDINYYFRKEKMIDGDYTDDGCCMEWENSKVTPTVMLD